MPELNVSIPHFYAKVRQEYLYNLEINHGKLIDCVVFGATSVSGRALGFNVILESGAQFARLPINALCHKECAKLTLGTLELWDCFGVNVVCAVFDYLQGMRVDAIIDTAKGFRFNPGGYVMTFDWWGNGFSDEPSQHKTAHLIKLDNGNFALQPNNRIRWHDAAFTKPFTLKERPDYKVNTHIFTAERDREVVDDEYSY